MKSNYNIIFFGNSKYSLIGAKIIHDKVGLSTIVTLEGSPLNYFAIEKNISQITTSIISDDIIEKICLQKPDFLVVEDYGLILPKKLLNAPKYVPLNIHHSLLPKYRGVAPAPFAILAGEKISGVTVIEMSKKFDAGDIVAQREYSLKPNETTQSLLCELNEIGANILLPLFEKYETGIVNKIVQNENEATYTHVLTRNDGFIDSKNPGDILTIDRKIRAYYPWPGAWTKIVINQRETRVKLFPDKILQVEGKRKMRKKDFLNGYPETKELIDKLL